MLKKIYLGEIMVSLNVITQEQLDNLLRIQRVKVEDLKIGELAVKHLNIDPEVVAVCVKMQHNVQSGYVKDEALKYMTHGECYGRCPDSDEK